jgi:SAM-dependent methyltransferase
VGPNGRVVGLELLQAAADLAQRAYGIRDSVTILHGNAERYDFEPHSFDVIFSRFGIMFFEDPVSAFHNLLKALRPGGRLGFVCWRDLSENEVDYLPLQAASPYLPADLVGMIASSGWFSFSNARHIRFVLGDAGFVEVEIASRDIMVGCGSVQETVDVCSRVGALGAILREHPHFGQDAVPALKRALEERDGPTGPTLRAATWIVTARTRH